MLAVSPALLQGQLGQTESQTVLAVCVASPPRDAAGLAVILAPAPALAPALRFSQSLSAEFQAQRAAPAPDLPVSSARRRCAAGAQCHALSGLSWRRGTSRCRRTAPAPHSHSSPARSGLRTLIVRARMPRATLRERRNATRASVRDTTPRSTGAPAQRSTGILDTIHSTGSRKLGIRMGDCVIGKMRVGRVGLSRERWTSVHIASD